MTQSQINKFLLSAFILTICFGVLSFLCSCVSVPFMFRNGHYAQDNIVEEIAEEIVESKTGLDLDFSPDTPETKRSSLLDALFPSS